jgi:uncharacterized protein (DUF342 family)
MGKEKDYAIEDLIRSSEELLNDISIEEIELERPSGSKKKIESEVQRRELKELAVEKKPSVDGIVELSVSKDGMLATADFYPPSGSGSDIIEEEVRDKFESFGIIFGIDWETVCEKSRQCNEEQVQINGVVVARGRPPEDEIPEQLAVDPRLKEAPGIEKDDSGSVDYKEHTSYTLVKKGETLARVVPKKEGKLGKTVKGELVPYRTVPVAQTKPGKNTKQEKDRLLATADGRFEIWNNHFWVHEVFDIHGDVDYHTGNISFPGDIIIHGTVNDGFKVDAGGSITCKGTLDASEVTCQRDLQVFRGIIGRQKGKITVGGTINTKYIENSWVEAKGSVFIDTGILHSIVRTQDRLVLSHKSIVAGGKIFAQNGVRAGQIGTRMGIKTELHVGIDHKVQQNLEWIKDKSVALASKLGQVEETIKARPLEGSALKQTRNRLKEYIKRLTRAAKTLVLQLDKNEKADIVVQGTVFPGVYIEICHVPYLVSCEMDRIRFYLDRERRKIDFQYL